MTTEAASKAATMITDGLDMESFDEELGEFEC